MTETSLTIRVDDDLKAAFLDAAKDMDRTGGQLIRDFMREYVRQRHEAAEYDAYVRHKIRLGQEAADAGRVVSHDDVEAIFAARRAAALRKADE